MYEPREPGPSEYDVTDPRTLTCELCDQKVAGRIRKELYGGHLMICEPCFHLVRSKERHPYSQIIAKFAMRACGYQVNVKMARMGAA